MSTRREATDPAELVVVDDAAQAGLADGFCISVTEMGECEVLSCVRFDHVDGAWGNT